MAFEQHLLESVQQASHEYQSLSTRNAELESSRAMFKAEIKRLRNEAVLLQKNSLEMTSKNEELRIANLVKATEMKDLILENAELRKRNLSLVEKNKQCTTKMMANQEATRKALARIEAREKNLAALENKKNVWVKLKCNAKLLRETELKLVVLKERKICLENNIAPLELRARAAEIQVAVLTEKKALLEQRIRLLESRLHIKEKPDGVKKIRAQAGRCWTRAVKRTKSSVAQEAVTRTMNCIQREHIKLIKKLRNLKFPVVENVQSIRKQQRQWEAYVKKPPRCIPSERMRESLDSLNLERWNDENPSVEQNSESMPASVPISPSSKDSAADQRLSLSSMSSDSSSPNTAKKSTIIRRAQRKNCSLFKRKRSKVVVDPSSNGPGAAGRDIQVKKDTSQERVSSPEVENSHRKSLKRRSEPVEIYSNLSKRRKMSKTPSAEPRAKVHTTRAKAARLKQPSEKKVEVKKKPRGIKTTVNLKQEEVGTGH